MLLWLSIVCPHLTINQSGRDWLQDTPRTKLLTLTTILGSNCISTSWQQGSHRSSCSLILPLEGVESDLEILITMSSPKTHQTFFQKTGTSCHVRFWRTYLIAPSAANSSYVFLLMEVIWIAENINPIKQI